MHENTYTHTLVDIMGGGGLDGKSENVSRKGADGWKQKIEKQIETNEKVSQNSGEMGRKNEGERTEGVNLMTRRRRGNNRTEREGTWFHACLKGFRHVTQNTGSDIKGWESSREKALFTLFVKANIRVKHSLMALQTSLFCCFITTKYYMERNKLMFKRSGCVTGLMHAGGFILADLRWPDRPPGLRHRRLSQARSQLSLVLHSGTVWGPSQTLWIHPKGFRCCGTQQ